MLFIQFFYLNLNYSNIFHFKKFFLLNFNFILKILKLISFKILFINLCFIFNDHVKNYAENGDYLNDEEGYYPANFGKKKNVVALVKIDMESGDIKRNTFFDRKEITAVAVPKLFHLDYNTKELLLYSVYGSKERFGLLKLED